MENSQYFDKDPSKGIVPEVTNKLNIKRNPVTESEPESPPESQPDECGENEEPSTIKITNSIFLDKNKYFINAINAIYELKLDIRISRQISKLINVISVAQAEFLKLQDKLYKDYGVYDEKARTYDVSKASQENKDIFSNEYISLVKVRINTELTKKIKISESKLLDRNPDSEFKPYYWDAISSVIDLVE